MKQRTTRRATALFVAGLLLAGALHTLDRLLVVSLLSETTFSVSASRAFGSTVLFVLNLSIYLGLLLWWIRSVRRRLLPSGGRTDLLLAGAFMLLFLLERAVKYRLSENGTLLEHVCWYAYYVPLSMIPTLFLLTCLRAEPTCRRADGMRQGVRAAALALILAVATNDLHYWMFRPLEGDSLGGIWGKYAVGPLWYVFYAYVALCVLLGLTLLARTDRKLRGGRRALTPALLLLLTLGMMFAVDRRSIWNSLPAPYFFPEIFVFGMLGIFESCIRSRLIPFNENYGGFFSRLELAAEITDPELTPVYATAKPVRAAAEQKREALVSPLPLDENTRLYGRRLRSGCLFWTGDDGTLRRLNEELADAAEVLETENELLRYENEQKAQRARVDARNRVYAAAERAAYDTQKRIAALLETLDPAAPDYRARLARILLLNAYVKRRTNFVMLSAERDTVTAEELALALDESARFLCLCSLNASVESTARRERSNAEAVALYDSFQTLAEALLGRTGALMISLSDDALRLMAECPLPEDLPATSARVEAEEEGGQLYLTVTAGKGAEG